MSNRFFSIIVSIVLISFCGFVSIQKTLAQNPDPWLGLNKVINNIKSPVFADKDFIITNYGAIGDGVTNCSIAIKDAVDECNKAGGGRVVVPAGKYCTGPVYIKSNVNLYLQKDATLLFSTNPDDYLPLVYTRWEGVELMNYSPLVYSYKEHNIAITGEGILDGQASKKSWWPWKGKKSDGWIAGTPNQTDADKRPALFAMAEKDIPATERKFGNGYYLRPQFVQPYDCQNVLIEGVTIINSPMWVLHPVLCNNITISKVKVEGNGPNTDGCDPESCKDVWIKDCYFNTGDDCIALKSGRNRDGRKINVPCENIVIQNCIMVNGHGGIVVGSEISGGVKNVFAENCKMNKPMWAIRIKSSTARGGNNENIFIRNLEVEQARTQAIVITKIYEDTGSFMPTFSNVQIKNVTVKKCGKEGIVIEGYPDSPVQNVQFTDVNIIEAAVPTIISNVKGLTFNHTFINGQEVK